MHRGLRGILFVALVGSFGVAGCGQSFLGANSSDEGSDEESEPDRAAYVMVPAGPQSVNVRVEKTTPLKVFLYERTSGEPATDETVDFEIVENANRGSLTAKSAETNANGGGSVDFRAGQSPGSVRVAASHPEANDIEFDLSLEPVPSGRLDLELVNTGASIMGLSDVAVRLYRSDQFGCDEFRPLAEEQPDPLRAKMRAEAGTTASFGDLPSEETYTAAAIARGTHGQIAAEGCLKNLNVPKDGVLERELLLHLIPLDPSGRYEATTHYDFSDAVRESGVVGENIIGVLEVFDNPGEAIYEEITDLVVDAFGDLLGKGVEWLLEQTGLDEDFENLINDTIQNNETLCKIREVGRDLRRAVTHLRVDSEMTIGNLRSSYEFQGRDNWKRLTIYWRSKCDGVVEDACSGEFEPPDESEMQERRSCAEVQLTPGQSEEVQEIGVWSTQWRGHVVSYNELQIDRHPVPIRYGKLLSYLLDEEILPELTDGNAHSLVEAFAYWLGCDSIASSITGSDGEVCAPDPLNQCITEDDIAGFCESSVRSVFSAADFLIGELKLETGIYVEGDGLLVERTSDARVDSIEDGVYEGYVEVTDEGLVQGRSDVEGTWRAERTSGEETDGEDP